MATKTASKPQIRMAKRPSGTRQVVRPTDLVWEETKSETVERFAYVPQYRDLLVVFRSGGHYVYRNVDPAIAARMRKAHPWHEVQAELKNPEKHPYERLGMIRTSPAKPRVVKAKRA